MEINIPREQCIRFDWCDSNLCPIDPKLNKRKYFDEPPCFYVREFMKIQAEKVSVSSLDPLEQNIIKAVSDNIELMMEIGGCKYRYRLNRSASSKSKKQAEIFILDNAISRGHVAVEIGSPDREREVA